MSTYEHLKEIADHCGKLTYNNILEKLESVAEKGLYSCNIPACKVLENDMYELMKDLKVARIKTNGIDAWEISWK